MPAGAKYGYMLLWVILAGELMAMIIQSMSAKLGIATGRNLPEVCRERFSRRTSSALWLQAEVIAMATDLAEFLGAALGFHLLFGTPLFLAGLVTGVVAFAILGLQAPRLPAARGRHRRPGRRDRDRLRLPGVPGRPVPRASRQGLFTPRFAGIEACCWRPASSARR